eukprot:2709962-Rhodomonas_salina.6
MAGKRLPVTKELGPLPVSVPGSPGRSCGWTGPPAARSGHGTCTSGWSSRVLLLVLVLSLLITLASPILVLVLSLLITLASPKFLCSSVCPSFPPFLRLFSSSALSFSVPHVSRCCLHPWAVPEQTLTAPNPASEQDVT